GQGGQGEQDHGVVGLSSVAEVVQRASTLELFLVCRVEAVLEVILENRARRGSLRAGQRVLGEVSAELLQVSVNQVDLRHVETGILQSRNDGVDLVERDQGNGVRLLRHDLRHL